jgi:lipopolysaccharide transport system permease protein
MADIATEQQLIKRGDAPAQNGFGVIRLVQSLRRNRSLLIEMTRRELTDLHAGQMAGVVWLVVHPLLQFSVYAFLFTLVLKVRIADRGPSDYLVYLFSGLVPWLLTQDVLARVSGTLVANVTIVKKVMFPTEVLVAKTLASSVAVQSILYLAMLIYIVSVRHAIPLTFLLLPVLVLLHLCLLWGLALLLSSVTPYFRDVPELVRVFLTINIYLIPIMYLPDMVPSPLRIVLAINPFSSLVWCYQDVLYFGAIRHPGAWLAMVVMSSATLIAGSDVFVRLRHHFASVL